MSIVSPWSADPEFSEAFRAYRNYIEDLAGAIGGHYGVASSMVEGVHDGVLTHPPVPRIRRKPLHSARAAAVERALRKAWGHVHRMAAEVEDFDSFEEEANAWLPTQAYYASITGSSPTPPRRTSPRPATTAPR